MFETHFANLYDSFFKVNKNVMPFLKEQIKDRPCRQVIDIACGTGRYLIPFFNEGYDTLGLDNDQYSLEIIKKKAPALAANLILGNMQDTKKLIHDKNKKKASLLYCLGNSLSFLNSSRELTKTLKMFKVLSKTVILHVFNFDKIGQSRDYSFKTLSVSHHDNKSYSFFRRYFPSEKKNHLYFEMSLKTPKKTYNRTFELMILEQSCLFKKLSELQFSQINCYGDFDKSPWRKDSPGTIFVADS